MKSRFIVFVFAFVLLVGFVNALDLNTQNFPTSPQLTSSDNSFTFTLNNNDGENFNLTSQNQQTRTATDSNGDSVMINLEAIGGTENINSTDFNVSLENVAANLNLGIYTVSFTLEGTNSTGATDSVTVNVNFEKRFYEGANKGNLRVLNIEFDTLSGFGDDEDFWYPLDEVEIEFEVDNQGNWDIEDIEIETCLYDESTQRCILDERDMDLSTDDFDLDRGDRKRMTVTFVVDPDSLRAGNEDYRFYVSAVGQIDDRDSEFNGDQTGDSLSKDIEIRTDNEFIVLDRLENVITASCGDTVEIFADVWNIGDNDLDNDEVFLRILNVDLGVNEVVQFVNGIDAMDHEVLRFLFEVPEDAEEMQYFITIVAYDDERLGNNDVFETEEDDEARYTVFLNVEDCEPEGPSVLISASLDSEARSGKELSVSTTITNIRDNQRTFVLSASDFDSWAQLSETPGAVSVPAGDSGEATFKFNVNKGVSGQQTFTINIYEGTELIGSQPVSVEIQPRGFLGITGLATGDGGNAHLWGLGIINVILVLVIIFVAVRVARRQRD